MDLGAEWTLDVVKSRRSVKGSKILIEFSKLRIKYLEYSRGWIFRSNRTLELYFSICCYE